MRTIKANVKTRNSITTRETVSPVIIHGNYLSQLSTFRQPPSTSLPVTRHCKSHEELRKETLFERPSIRAWILIACQGLRKKERKTQSSPSTFPVVYSYGLHTSVEHISQIHM